MLCYRFLEGRPSENIWVLYSGEIAFDKTQDHVLFPVLLDAITHASGRWLTRISADESNEITQFDSAIIARRRKCEWAVDVSTRAYVGARELASTVAHLWQPPADVSSYLSSGVDRPVAFSAAIAAQDRIAQNPDKLHPFSWMQQSVAALSAIKAAHPDPVKALQGASWFSLWARQLNTTMEAWDKAIGDGLLQGPDISVQATSEIEAAAVAAIGQAP